MLCRVQWSGRSNKNYLALAEHQDMLNKLCKQRVSRQFSSPCVLGSPDPGHAHCFCGQWPCREFFCLPVNLPSCFLNRCKLTASLRALSMELDFAVLQSVLCFFTLSQLMSFCFILKEMADNSLACAFSKPLKVFQGCARCSS